MHGEGKEKPKTKNENILPLFHFCFSVTPSVQSVKSVDFLQFFQKVLDARDLTGHASGRALANHQDRLLDC